MRSAYFIDRRVAFDEGGACMVNLGTLILPQRPIPRFASGVRNGHHRHLRVEKPVDQNEGEPPHDKPSHSCLGRPAQPRGTLEHSQDLLPRGGPRDSLHLT